MANGTFAAAALLCNDKNINYFQNTQNLYIDNRQHKPISCHQYYFTSLTYFSDNRHQTLKFGNIVVEQRQWNSANGYFRSLLYQLSVRLQEMHAGMHLHQKGIYYCACKCIALAYCLSLTDNCLTKFTHTTLAPKPNQFLQIIYFIFIHFRRTAHRPELFTHSSRFETNLFYRHVN